MKAFFHLWKNLFWDHYPLNLSFCPPLEATELCSTREDFVTYFSKTLLIFDLDFCFTDFMSLFFRFKKDFWAWGCLNRVINDTYMWHPLHAIVVACTTDLMVWSWKLYRTLSKSILQTLEDSTNARTLSYFCYPPPPSNACGVSNQSTLSVCLAIDNETRAQGTACLWVSVFLSVIVFMAVWFSTTEDGVIAMSPPQSVWLKEQIQTSVEWTSFPIWCMWDHSEYE